MIKDGTLVLWNNDGGLIDPQKSVFPVSRERIRFRLFSAIKNKNYVLVGIKNHALIHDVLYAAFPVYNAPLPLSMYTNHHRAHDFAERLFYSSSAHSGFPDTFLDPSNR